MESTNEHSPLEEKSPGQQLVELREAAGLSLAYVAEQMNLTEYYITSLEADEFSKLPPDPYVLGYYRTYARLLNISPQPLISSYRKLRQLPDETPGLASATGSGTTRTASDLYRKPMVLDRNTRLSGKKKGAGVSIYVIAAVILVAIWIVVSLLADKTDPVVVVAPEGAALEIAVSGNTDSPADLAEVSDEFDIDVPDQTALDTPELSVGETAESAAVGAESVAAVESAATGESAAAAEPAAPAVAEVSAPVLDQLSFVFSGECWLEVTDANGDILAATLYQEGDSAQLAGVAPFEIMLGNVRAAQLQLNGEAVALRALDNRKTLRMTLEKPKSATAE